jgi:hypothetical protein
MRAWRPARAAIAVAMAALLCAHFALRRHVDAVIPRGDRAFYSEHYAVAISLVAGRGFHAFDLTGEQANWPESPTVAKFLAGDKEDLREGRLKVFLDTARTTPPPPEAFGRVLDLHLAGWLWRVFGIAWTPLFVLYALVSTAACLGVFFLGRRIGGAPAGLLAAALFLASPFEAMYAAYSIRDLSPLWFAVAAFAAASAAGAASRPAAFLAGALGAGVAATLGVGWRPDAVLLPPFAALVMAGSALARGIPVRRTVLAVGALAIGAALTWKAIAGLAGGDVGRPPSIGFHIAAYGSHTRSNVLAYENSFLAARDDTQTYFNVAHHAAAAAGVRPLTYGGAEYADECRRLFLAMARSEGYRWLTGFPRFYARSLAALGDEASVQSVPASELQRLRPPAAAAFGRYVLDPLARSLPALFAVGALAALIRGRDRVLAWALAGFSVAYAGALLTVLPESKHFGPMLLPLCVLGGQVAGRARRLQASSKGPRAKPLAIAALACVAVAVVVLRVLATADRRAYLSDIEGRLAGGTSEGTIEGARFTSPWRAPGADPDPAGYAVEIDAGDAPGPVHLRQERGRPGEPSPRIHVTRHRVPPGARATLFVTALQGEAYGDIRSHRCVVEASGSARILSARRVPLDGWRRPLFATVIVPGEVGPGNPKLDEGPFATRLVHVFSTPPPD